MKNKDQRQKKLMLCMTLREFFFKTDQGLMHNSYYACFPIIKSTQTTEFINSIMMYIYNYDLIFYVIFCLNNGIMVRKNDIYDTYVSFNKLSSKCIDFHCFWSFCSGGITNKSFGDFIFLDISLFVLISHHLTIT